MANFDYKIMIEDEVAEQIALSVRRWSRVDVARILDKTIDVKQAYTGANAVLETVNVAPILPILDWYTVLQKAIILCGLSIEDKDDES